MRLNKLREGLEVGGRRALLAALLAVAALGAPVAPRAARDYGKLPLAFEANLGQHDPQVQYVSRRPGYTIFLTSDEAVLSLRRVEGEQTTTDAVRMRAVGASPAPQIEGRDELITKSNYFIGGDPSRWRTDVPNYSRVQYREVYLGVDLVFHGNQRRLEYDFVVAPGADPSQIRLAFEGVERLWIDEQGDLVLEVAGGELRQHRPVVYQEAGEGVREAVSGSFVLKGSNEVAFAVAPYDEARPLVIDPSLSYLTYLGGSGSDIGRGVAVDGSGNAYVTGETTSVSFGGPGALRATTDIFVAKVNSSGTALLYSTFVGGGITDIGNAIAVDGSGNAYVAGQTNSPDFPTPSGWDTTYNAGNEIGRAHV